MTKKTRDEWVSDAVKTADGFVGTQRRVVLWLTVALVGMVASGFSYLSPQFGLLAGMLLGGLALRILFALRVLLLEVKARQVR